MKYLGPLALVSLTALSLIKPLYAMAQSDEDSWQLDMLHKPTAQQTKVEQKGRVFIYDGLDNEDVEKALDDQFDRIQHMMFVGIRHRDPDGGDSSVDDDCD